MQPRIPSYPLFGCSALLQTTKRVLVTWLIVYRQVCEVPSFPHFEPCLDSFSLRYDVISSIQILSPFHSLKASLSTDNERRSGRNPHPPPPTHFKSLDQVRVAILKPQEEILTAAAAPPATSFALEF